MYNWLVFSIKCAKIIIPYSYLFIFGNNEITIRCDPNATRHEWQAIGRGKRTGIFHWCHADAVRPLEGGVACLEAARQINTLVNSSDDLPDWWFIHTNDDDHLSHAPVEALDERNFR